MWYNIWHGGNMYKFFVNSGQIFGERFEINGSDVNHIVNVLRLNSGNKIIVCDRESSISYIAEIESIDKERVVGHIVEEVEDTTEAGVSIDLFQGLPKADKMEYIIQKTTELGVKRIFPVAMDRCIVKIDGKSETKKLDRWQKIAEVAAKQSKRDVVPKIENIFNLENICQNMGKYDIILLAYENENKISLKEELRNLNRNKELKIGVVIGPEGGFSEGEVQKLVNAGARCVSLGKRILRTETAPIVAIANIIYEFEL